MKETSLKRLTAVEVQLNDILEKVKLVEVSDIQLMATCHHTFVKTKSVRTK